MIISPYPLIRHNCTLVLPLQKPPLSPAQFSQAKYQKGSEGDTGVLKSFGGQRDVMVGRQAGIGGQGQ